MTKLKYQTLIFKLFACCLIIIIGFHCYCLFDLNCRPSYPKGRHLFWIIINIVGIYYLVHRRWYIIPIIIVLTIQQVSGHGTALINHWHNTHEISVIHLFPVVFVPLLLIVYSYDIFNGYKK